MPPMKLVRKRKRKKRVYKGTSRKKELERQEKQQKFQEIIKAKATINKPVTLGKIDLDHPKSKTKIIQLPIKTLKLMQNLKK